MINVIKTDIEGVVIIEPRVFGDERGYFMETWSQRDFDAQVRPIQLTSLFAGVSAARIISSCLSIR